MTPWYASLYTGLFAHFGPVPARPHDPTVCFTSGTLAAEHGGQELTASGAGWDRAGAEAACVGEGVERWQARPLPDDQRIEASFAAWSLDEPAGGPERRVLFHPEQYAQAGFPFQPFTPATVCRWVCCRQALTGDPWWVPEEFAYLSLGPGERHCLCPGVSTGLACGRTGDPVLLRGLQEVIERDGVMGAWWGRYAVEEWRAEDVLALLWPAVAQKLLRPNLRYRCYRVDSPCSDHVTIATVEGEDLEGYCFSAGSACRETRAGSWEKSLLEAVHGRQYVRYLKGGRGKRSPGREPATFAEHAAYYSFFPDDLRRTVLHTPPMRPVEALAARREDLAALVARLGPERPVLCRDMTPPALAQEGLGWHVLRVLVPGLQPLHGNHRLPQLGGSLWAPRGAAEWAALPPHPFP